MNYLTKIFPELKQSGEEIGTYSFDGANCLENLSKVNVFIGANNSGKSRLLRALFSQESMKYSTSEIEDIKKDVEDYVRPINGFINGGYRNYTEIKREIDAIKERIEQIHIDSFYSSNRRTYADMIEKIDKEIQKLITKTRQGSPDKIKNKDAIHQEVKKLKSSKDFMKQLKQPIDFKRKYIPILRGLRPIDNDKDALKERIESDYFGSIDGNWDIITGQQINKEIREHLLSVRRLRDKVGDFEKFISEKFFNGKAISIVPQEGKNVPLVGIEEEERLIYEIGDGTQSIITLLYPVYMHKDEDVIYFIEEPENYMHPGFQRIFMETILSDEFENAQFFISTHSNHLLDITTGKENVSIYSFKKEKISFNVKNVTEPSFKLYSELGVRTSSVLLSNCTIWVEGITDRLYIKNIIDILKKEKSSQYGWCIEDLHYSFIEYAGSNITHWNFCETDNEGKIKASKISNSIFVIVDSDVNSNGNFVKHKEERYKTLRNCLQDKLYITEGKEIENMLSPNTIVKIIESYSDSV
ncbi:MAG: hypothetical protein C0594_16185 [Marinilabiliales bacterium]|nr:MAG: hypothetical protein C0594_16185 [Marinilabiliales bacterium]